MLQALSLPFGPILKKILRDYGLLLLSLVALVGISLMAIGGMSYMSDTGQEVFEEGFKTYQKTAAGKMELLKQKSELRQALSQLDMDKVAESKERFEALSKPLSAVFEGSDVASDYANYQKLSKEFFGLVEMFAQDQGGTLLEAQMVPLEKKLDGYLLDVEQKVQKMAEGRVADMGNAASRLTWQIFGLVTALVLVITVIGIVLGRQQAKRNRQVAIMNSAVASMQTNVFMANENDEIVYLNEACREALPSVLSSVNVGSVTGLSLKDIKHEDTIALLEKAHTLEQGEKHTCHIKLGERVLDVSFFGIYDGDDRLGTYADWADITEKFQMEEEKERIRLHVQQTMSEAGKAAKDMSAGNANLSQRTEAQAANVEETTATVQQMTEQVKHSTDGAHEAKTMAMKAQQAAVEGREVVQSAISAMSTIDESAEKIADIIGLIDEIAFQTNLLALNAAVEAARAGEAGRGFAVVAAEVRGLAGRSADAAKQIKDLITMSVEQIKDGTKRVNGTGECLENIANTVGQVTERITQIADMAQDQQQGINEINAAISQVDSFTQQNAALVEEATSASKSLEDQIVSVVEIVNQNGGK